MSKPTTAHRPSFLQSFTVLFAKDLRQEFRTRDMLTAMGLYAILILIVYGATVATSATALDLLPLSSGLFWAIIVFTSLLGLNRTFNHEQRDRAIEGLLLAPVDRSAIFFSKATANALFLLLVVMVCCPLYWFLFLADTSLPTNLGLATLPLLLGIVGIAGVGTLIATITMRSRSKDILLAVLMVPIIYPLLYASVTATSAVLVSSSGSMDTYCLTVALAAGYDAIMLVLAWMLYGIVIEA